jgi:PST family polysaccharide transporter
VKSKYTVFAKNSAFILISTIKMIMIWTKCPLICFGWAWLGEMMMNAVGLMIVFHRRDHSVKKWIFDKSLAAVLLKQSVAIYIAFIASFTYMKVDQIMISKMLNDTQAGLFAASARIYDLCFFIIVVLTPSFYPSLIHVYEKDKTLFYKRYQQVTDLFTLLGYAVLVFVLLFGDIIIRILYSAPYSPASVVLKIQILGILFMFNGGLRSSFCTITGNLKVIMVTTTASAVLNILLNFYLIRRIGITGSAIATVVTHATSLFFSNAFFKGTLPIFKIQLKSMLCLNIFRQMFQRKRT